MKEELGYLSEEELSRLIAEAEGSGRVAPPVYLKDCIMDAARGIKVISMDAEKRKRAAKLQFLTYSLKIFSAAAAAVFCLTVVPLDFSAGFAPADRSRVERRIDENMERHEERNKRLLERTQKSDWKEAFDTKSEEFFRMWNGLNLKDGGIIG